MKTTNRPAFIEQLMKDNELRSVIMEIEAFVAIENALSHSTEQMTFCGVMEQVVLEALSLPEPN